MPLPAISQVQAALKGGNGKDGGGNNGTIAVPRTLPVHLSTAAAPIAMRLNRTWIVQCPPAKQVMVHGTTTLMMPNLKNTLTLGGRLQLRSKIRRLALELHGPDPETTNSTTTTTTSTTAIPSSSSKFPVRRDAVVGVAASGGGDRQQHDTTNDAQHKVENEEDDDDDDELLSSRMAQRSQSKSPPPPSCRRRNDGKDGFRAPRLIRSQETLSQTMQLSKELLDDDRIVVRIWKPRKVWGFSRDPDDSSDDSDTEQEEDETTMEDDEEEDEDDKKKVKTLKKHDTKTKNSDNVQDDAWVEYRKYGIDEIINEELKGRHQKTIFEATMGLGANQERREIHFENEQQAQQFWTELQQLKRLVKERAQHRLEAFQESQRQTQETIHRASDILPTSHQELSRSMRNWTANSEIQLLLEIVSATDIPIADRLHQASDPYVIVYLGKEEIHRTNVIPRTVNPIWTMDTGCLCLLSTTAEDFFHSSAGLTFVLKDKDALSSDDMLATASISQSTLLQLTGQERVALPLQVHKAHKYNNNRSASSTKKRFSRKGDGAASGGVGRNAIFPPTLYIRARTATEKDQQFMKNVQRVQQRKSLGVYANQTFVAPPKERVKLLKRESKMVDGIRKYRIKPHPDPSRPEQETKWLDNDALLKETMKPTYKWVEAGTGSLGRLYLEVLKCDGLPNMDSHLDGVTDAFCCIIYEDAIVNTDVINDTLKPRWPPWCQRGFLFRMAHPSSQILLGVFDYDSEKKMSFSSHDPIGRISIDITNFRRNTEYVLTYDLYRQVLANERNAYGTVTVRLRLEYDSYRELVKGSLDLPPINYINLPQKAAFKTSYFVIHGEENLQRFDMDAIMAYRTELEEYLIILHYIKRAAITVFLWRGHRHVKIGRVQALVPLHSMIAFGLGITLIENFNLAPSYFLFSIAWLLLATNEMRQKHPSPWHSSLTYLQLWHAVIANEAPPVIVDAHENEALIKAYEEERKENQERQMARAQEARERAAQIDALFSEERNSAAEAFSNEQDLSTKLRGPLSLNPLARCLLPIQQILGQICKTLRITSSVVIWNESIYAFLIVNACLIVGFALLWFPWSLVIRWVLRVAIWVTLGPWMKLFDILYVQKHMAEDDVGDETTMFQKLLEERLHTYTITREALMRAKEEILKMRSLKRYMFGRFVTRIPQLKEYRYPDVPRAESYARPLRSPPAIIIERRSHGQTLVGPMVPTWGDAVDAERLESKRRGEQGR